jgi:hypothetical protein
MQEQSPTTKAMISAIKLIALLVIALVALIASCSVFENLDASHVMVIQSPVKGKLTWFTNQGIKYQGFGKVTKYPRRSSYEFKTPVRFNDGGHGTMNGSVQIEIPLDIPHLTNMHIKYGSWEAVETQLVGMTVNKCIYMTGPLMSSKESYAEKRNYLLNYVEDQISNGVYKTVQKDVKTTDPITNNEKTVTTVDIVKDEHGIPARQEEPVLKEYGIRTFNFSITSLPYDEAVEGQIKQQQQINMDVQTAIASAKRAEQNVITVSKQGEANAAEAKWKQEVVKAQAVTEAQQKLDVATLAAKAAEQTKREQILLGEGEAERKKLVMNANGALDVKLEAWKYVNEKYADAIAKYPGAWVPSIVMGGEGKGYNNGANELINLLIAQTAKGIALDAGMRGK